jgi:hypothetical protein
MNKLKVHVYSDTDTVVDRLVREFVRFVIDSPDGRPCRVVLAGGWTPVARVSCLRMSILSRSGWRDLTKRHVSISGRWPKGSSLACRRSTGSCSRWVHGLVRLDWPSAIDGSWGARTTRNGRHNALP